MVTISDFVSAQASPRTFFGVLALLFAGSVAATITGYESMSSMSEMPMPGGRAMSMAWMPACGQTWAGAAGSFAGMWTPMMIAMMLPSVAPRLWDYRIAAARAGAAHPARLAALAGLGYFFVWSMAGLAVFALGAASTAVAMPMPAFARAAPLAGGFVVALAGALQFTAWKARRLACCRAMSRRCGDAPSLAVGTGRAAWRDGLRLGIHCCQCCAGLTAVLLVVGIMDLRAMIAVTLAITAERLAPGGEHVARVVGAVVVIGGLGLIARAAGLV